MAEARCGHGFLRSAVPCPTCDVVERKRPDPLPLPATNSVNLIDLCGKTIAGCFVDERAPRVSRNTQWICVCGCGGKFTEFGTTLRRNEQLGRTSLCDACKEKRKLARTGSSNPNLKAYPIPAEHAIQAPLLRSVPKPTPLDLERALRWWRLELDAKGSVLSCTPVERRGEAGENQFLYVEAHDQQEAGRLAWNAYCRLGQARHRARMTAEGKCPWCGRKQDREPGRRCNTCLASDRSRAATNKAIKAGELVPAPGAQVARATRLQSEREEYRLQILSEVRRVALERAPVEFLRWLDEELGADGGQVTARKATG